MFFTWFDSHLSCRRLSVALLFCLATAAGAATFSVTTASNDGAGSLRQAITDANATPGLDIIAFHLTGTAPFVINLASALPPVNEAAVVDATTQPEFAQTHKPVVVLNGYSVLTANGLTLNASGTTVRGLVFEYFGKYGIEASGSGGHTIQSCFIGLDASGTLGRSNNFGGLHLNLSADNLIGGTNAWDGNVISGNNVNGILIDGGPASTRNVIVGNRIGTSWDGSGAVPNREQGVRIAFGPGNTVGGPNSGARNVISGNGQSGVVIEGVSALNNVVQGNLIGTSTMGLTALPNGEYGVRVLSGARWNQIGGPSVGSGNVISGNLLSGIDLSNGAFNNTVQGNLIGTTATGTNALPNAQAGVNLYGATNNLIGGILTGARNVLSGNGLSGVNCNGITTRSNRVEGNFIGVDSSGTKRLGNGFSGVLLENSPANQVGSAMSGGGNVIAANGFHGIVVKSALASGNQIAGNFIGTDVTGTVGLGNGTNSGVVIDHAPNTRIGGIEPGARNLISSNLDGIYITGNTATNTLIQGNYIGTDANGAIGLGNRNQGVSLIGTPVEPVGNTIIGGAITGAGNVISDNGVTLNYRPGVYLLHAFGTVLQGNLVGVKADGVGALGNLAHNIELENATNTVIGGTSPGMGNIIANSRDGQRSGVRIRSGHGNAILGNSIFANGKLGISFSGTIPTPNDDRDPDAGPNALQNYPVISSVVSDGAITDVKGYLNSIANQTYRLDFYASPLANASGYGEGQVFLGSETLALSGVWSNGFAIHLDRGVPAGWVVSATATDTPNNTSEFSQTRMVSPAPRLSVIASGLAQPQTTLSWLVTNVPGDSWQLMQTTNLKPPVVWAPVTNSPTVTSNGTFFSVTLARTNPASFFRLIHQ